jgi:hypothetical protein
VARCYARGVDGYSLLKQAIRTRRPVSGRYDGKRRLFCPHVLGFKDGEARCLAYQFGGETGSAPIVPGAASNWRCFVVWRLAELQLLDTEWQSGPSHQRNQSCIDIVDVDSERPQLEPALARQGGRPDAPDA